MLKQTAAVAAVALSSLSLAAGAIATTHHQRSAAVSHHRAAHDLGLSSVPTPTVAGPVSTPLAANRVQGFPYTASAIDLRSYGYTCPPPLDARRLRPSSATSKWTQPRFTAKLTVISAGAA